MIKTALTIAGSDCSGGAGIQADIKTFSAHGVFAMSVVTSVVAENTVRVIEIQNILPAVIENQIDAVFEDIPPDAVKIGMLSVPETMAAVAKKLDQWGAQNVVLDPVMYAKNGSALMSPDAIDTLISAVIPRAGLITPNLPEAERIAGMTIENLAGMEDAARKILAMGCKAALIKGGHASGGDATDVLFDGREFHRFSAKRIDTKNTHGTGCTYSAAIAANLAKGMELTKAVEKAKAYVTTAIAHALPLGKGHGPTNHFYDLYRLNGGIDAH